MWKRIEIKFVVLLLGLASAALSSYGFQEFPESSAVEADSAAWADSFLTTDSLLPSMINPRPVHIGFGEGEKLVFSIQYGIVTAGEATLEVRNIAVIDGRAAYHIISDARSNEVFSVFFKVRDRFESFMDTTKLVSLRYEKHLREGRYKKDEVVIFDQENHKAQYKEKVVDIRPETQDVLSALYYVRTLPLEVGKSIAIANHTDGKNYPILVKVLRKERVRVEAGTFDCIVVEPLLQSSGVFRHKGKLTVWLTDNKARIPVLMKSKVVIGAISAVLKEFTLASKWRSGEQVRRGGFGEDKTDSDR